MNVKKYVGVATLGLCIATTSLYGCANVTRNGVGNRGRDINNQSMNRTGTTPLPIPGQQLGIDGNVTPPVVPPTPGIVPTPGIAATPAPQAVAQPTDDSRQRADHIRSQLGLIKEINKAHVVVMGNKALVGISPSTPDQDVNATKNAVIDRVKKADNRIDNVTVSESPDLLTRIGRLYNDMVNGRPASETTNEFNQLIQSVIPMNR